MGIPHPHERVVVDKEKGTTVSKLAIYMAISSGCSKASQYFESRRQKTIEENKKALKEKAKSENEKSYLV
jgi:hypothetical protein